MIPYISETGQLLLCGCPFHLHLKEREQNGILNIIREMIGGSYAAIFGAAAFERAWAEWYTVHNDVT